MKWIVVVLALLVGIGVGIAYQRSVSHNTINIRVGVASQRALVNPQPGDLIRWYDPAGNGVNVSWSFGSPCALNSPGSDTSQCRVLPSANNLTYAYDCPNNNPCDPDVPIGSDLGTGTKGQARHGEAAPELRQPRLVNLGCLNGSIGAKPSPAQVSSSLEGAVVWQGLGPATNNWSISSWKDGSGNPATVCQEGQIGNAQPRCSLVNGLAAGQYTYQLTSSACTAKPTDTFAVQVSQ